MRTEVKFCGCAPSQTDCAGHGKALTSLKVVCWQLHLGVAPQGTATGKGQLGTPEIGQDNHKEESLVRGGWTGLVSHGF